MTKTLKYIVDLSVSLLGDAKHGVGFFRNITFVFGMFVTIIQHILTADIYSISLESVSGFRNEE